MIHPLFTRVVATSKIDASWTSVGRVFRVSFPGGFPIRQGKNETTAWRGGQFSSTQSTPWLLPTWVCWEDTPDFPLFNPHQEFPLRNWWWVGSPRYLGGEGEILELRVKRLDTQRIHVWMYGIFGYIWLIFMRNVEIQVNIPYMDPMGYVFDTLTRTNIQIKSSSPNEQNYFSRDDINWYHCSSPKQKRHPKWKSSLNQ